MTKNAMTKTNTKKVALYARTATVEGSGERARAQLNRLTEYAAGRGYRVHRVYTDFGFSGLTGKRPALARLLQEAEAGKFEALVVEAPDRIARDLALLARTAARLKRSAVRVEYVAAGTNTTPQHPNEYAVGKI
jgi:site-specific DNA recombinase